MGGRLDIPDGYILDESDPDILALRRADGSVVAFFSADGAMPDLIEHIAWEDARKKLGAPPPQRLEKPYQRGW